MDSLNALAHQQLAGLGGIFAAGDEVEVLRIPSCWITCFERYAILDMLGQAEVVFDVKALVELATAHVGIHQQRLGG